MNLIDSETKSKYLRPGLEKELLLVSLTIGHSSFTQRVRSMEADLQTENEVDQDAKLRVSLNWLSSSYRKPISKAITDLRTYHYRTTLPWTDGQDRVLPTASLANYSTTMKMNISYLKNAFEKVSANWEEVTKLAIANAGKLSQRLCLPTLEDWDKAFTANFEVKPFPKYSPELASSVPEVEFQHLVADLEQKNNQRMKHALRNLLGQIRTPLADLLQRLSQDTQERVRYGGWKNSVETLLSSLHQLNLTKDADVSKLINDTITFAHSINPENLRASQHARNEAIEKANTFLNDADLLIGSL